MPSAIKYVRLELSSRKVKVKRGVQQKYCKINGRLATQPCFFKPNVFEILDLNLACPASSLQTFRGNLSSDL